MTDPDSPAFSAEWFDSSSGQTQMQYAKGLTKREYFAAQALPDLIEWDAVMNKQSPDRAGNVGNIASGCVALADALIKELNKNG